MSKREEFERACVRKIRYASEPPSNNVVSPYRCPICEGWHMTSKLGQPTGRQRRKAAYKARRAP